MQKRVTVPSIIQIGIANFSKWNKYFPKSGHNFSYVQYIVTDNTAIIFVLLQKDKMIILMMSVFLQIWITSASSKIVVDSRYYTYA